LHTVEANIFTIKLLGLTGCKFAWKSSSRTVFDNTFIFMLVKL